MSRPLPTPQRVPVPLASMDGVPPSASAYSQSYSRHQSYAQYPGTAYSGGGFPASEPQYEEEEEEVECDEYDMAKWNKIVSGRCGMSVVRDRD